MAEAVAECPDLGHNGLRADMPIWGMRDETANAHRVGNSGPARDFCRLYGKYFPHQYREKGGGCRARHDQGRGRRCAARLRGRDYARQDPLRRLPLASVPPGSFRNLAELLPAGKRRVALRPMLVNEPILATKITGEGQGASIAALLPDGMRAAAVRLNDVSGVAGFVQPNDSVDVLITRQQPGGDGQLTDVLLQNIRVIATDQDAQGPTASRSWLGPPRSRSIRLTPRSWRSASRSAS